MVKTKVKYQNCYVLTVSIFKFSASLSQIILNKKLISLPLQAFLKLIKMLSYRFYPEIFNKKSKNIVL